MMDVCLTMKPYSQQQNVIVQHKSKVEAHLVKVAVIVVLPLMEHHLGP
jgi:hypothetical protein